jgi:hypothetical protein
MDLAYYTLERTNPDATVTQLLTSDDAQDFTGFADTGLVPDAWYTYTIRVVDQVGTVSAGTSTEVGTGANAVLQPQPATDLAVQAFGSTAKLTWTASASADVTGYLVYKDGDAVEAVASVATPYCTIDQGWDTAATYQVKPIASGSTPSATQFASLTVGPPLPAFQAIDGINWIQLSIGTKPTFTLNVMNNVQSGKSATITLKYLGPEGKNPSVTVPPVATNLPYSSTIYGAQWSGLDEGYYQFSWVTSNNKTGSRLVQLTSPTLTYNEKCVP